MKPEECHPAEDITAEVHALEGENAEASSSTEPFLTGDLYAGLNMENRDSQSEFNKSSSVTSDVSVEKSDVQYSDSLWMVKEVNTEITGERSIFDDPTDDGMWFPPSAETEDILDMLGDEEDEDDNVDGVEWGRVSWSEFKEQKEKEMEDVKNGKFRMLVSQLLKTIGIANSEKDIWEDIVSPLAWEAALIVKPEAAAQGKAKDPAGYVKVKCVATGSRTDSKLIKGLVFKKHAAHKHMATKYTKPKLMLIQGTLGHSSGLSSFNSMIPQDKDNVPKNSPSSGLSSQGKDNVPRKENMSEDAKKFFGQLEVYLPNVIMMESAPRDVVEDILKKGMTLVVDMKLHRLERIARYTGSPIWSANNMQQAQQLRQCDMLYFEKYVEEHGQLGEGGKTPPHKTLMFLEDSRKCLGCTILLKGSKMEELKKIKCVVQCAVVMACHYILETSFLIDQEAMFSTVRESCKHGDEFHGFDEEFSVRSDMINIPISGSINQESVKLVSSANEYIEHFLNSDNTTSVPIAAATNDEISPHLDDTVCDADGSDSDEFSGKKDDISAVLDSESILISMSSRNVLTGTVCEQSRFSHIKFYRNFDVPLGKFLQDNVLNQSVPCKTCGEQPEAHFYYYAHNNKQLMIRVKQIPGLSLPGESAGNLWMWSRCGKCKYDKEAKNNITKLVLMSRAARGLSFGKFLELSFSNYSSSNKLSKCGHSLHRDFLCFFGLGRMVSMFRYSPVAKYTVAVPPQKIEFNSPVKGDWLHNETQTVHSRVASFFSEVSGYLKKNETNIDIEKMLAVEQYEFEEKMKSNCRNNGDSMRKLLGLNCIRWELFLEACIWNRRMQLLLNTKDSEISRGQWIWKSFSEIREECVKDILKTANLPSFLDSFRFNPLHSPEFLPTVSRIINEEAARVHIPLSDHQFIVSEYTDEISTVIACAVAFIKEGMPASTNNESLILPRSSSVPHPLSSLSTISPAAALAPTMSSMDFSFSSFDGLAALDGAHPVVALGVESKPKYSVVCLYAKEFRCLRNLCCPSEIDYIASLSRCKVWDAKGGKSKAFFAKTLDDRFIIKEIKRTEFESFTKFASQYFKYMKQSFESGNRTCLAKILGIYQVTVRQPKSGKETKHGLVVIEHLSYGRNHLSRQYDLKGALHARYTASTDGSGDVLLDQNFVNDMNLSPLYIGQTAKRLLQRAVWNDTTFLNSINVMDYSLLVGVDLKQKELVCGIIDYLRQYTLDKQLETWVKSSLVVPKNLQPTIISPKEYKKRFRKFMDTHFLTVPDQWCSRRPNNPCKLCGLHTHSSS